MSPTSYQAAPPRAIDTTRLAVLLQPRSLQEPDAQELLAKHRAIECCSRTRAVWFHRIPSADQWWIRGFVLTGYPEQITLASASRQFFATQMIFWQRQQAKRLRSFPDQFMVNT